MPGRGNERPTTPVGRRRGDRWRLPVAVAAGLLLGGAAGFAVRGENPASVPAVPAGGGAAASGPTRDRAKVAEPDRGTSLAGPWGELRMTSILIAPPDTAVNPAQCTTTPEPWFLYGMDRGATGQWLALSGMGPEWVAAVLATARCEAGQGCALEPGVDLLGAMTPQARAVLYRGLAHDPRNIEYFLAFSRPADRVERWLEASGLAPSSRDLVRSLMYPRRGDLAFSDAAVACSRLGSDGEKARLVKALSRTRGVVASLQVPEGADVEALWGYWGRGPSHKDARPLLESLASRPGGGIVDVIHLLPAFVRARVNTFPGPNDPIVDCHWTSFNFFSDVPDAGFLEMQHIVDALRTQYHRVAPSEAGLGDVVLFVLPNGDIIHSAVEVAGPIVFTKNGASPLRPWVLASLADLEMLYFSEVDQSLEYWRRNDR